MKRLAILGSTGSIGTQTLEVAARFPEHLQVIGLSAGRNIELLVQQVNQFRPEVVAVAREEDVRTIREAVADPRLRVSAELSDVAQSDCDLLVGAMVGSAGLDPVLSAVAKGTDVALANKEVLVMAGELVMRAASLSGARILPLDSEHVAIHQCLSGHPRDALRKVVLTASGGPFLRASPARIASATPEEALAHPNWEMGQKISIDSATLMNKGFEVIEARWLFDLGPDRIDVVIHPESIVHSLVEFEDRSWLAQLGMPDMRIPIAYALALPERFPLRDLPSLDLVKLGKLHFEAPDAERFPALRLARTVLAQGGTAPAALNAANEVAVQAFLEQRLPFTGIAEVAERVLEDQPIGPALEVEAILETDRQARERTRRWIEEHGR